MGSLRELQSLMQQVNETRDKISEEIRDYQERLYRANPGIDASVPLDNNEYYILHWKKHNRQWGLYVEHTKSLDHEIKHALEWPLEIRVLIIDKIGDLLVELNKKAKEMLAEIQNALQEIAPLIQEIKELDDEKGNR